MTVETAVKTWIVLNVHGLAIGIAVAANRQAAVRAWNFANAASHEVAVDAYAIE